MLNLCNFPIAIGIMIKNDDIEIIVIINNKFCFLLTRMRTASLHVPHTTSSFGIVEWHNEARESIETTMTRRLAQARLREENANWAHQLRVHRHQRASLGPLRRMRRWLLPVKGGLPGPPDLLAI